MKGLGTKKLFLATLLLAHIAGNAHATNLAERADAILLNMLGAVGATRDYQARFIVQTQVAGRMRSPESLFIKQRREPSCIYIQWLDGPRQSAEHIFCSEEPPDTSTVRLRGRTLMNRKSLSRAQMKALQVVLRPVDDEGLYGMVARYANQYFDAAQNARPDDFVVELRQATVFNRPSSCLRIRRRQAIPNAPFQGQSEMCIDDRIKLPSAFRNWDANGNLLESYLMGDYEINTGLDDADFDLIENSAKQP